jgi:hypothetical protein
MTQHVDYCVWNNKYFDPSLLQTETHVPPSIKICSIQNLREQVSLAVKFLNSISEVPAFDSQPDIKFFLDFFTKINEFLLKRFYFIFHNYILHDSLHTKELLHFLNEGQGTFA